MFRSCFSYKTLNMVVVCVLLLQAQVSFGQAQTLLRLQRSTMAAEIDATGGMRGQGGSILSLGTNPSQMGTATYPSTASCLVVYNDGRYFFEKRDEHTVGKPKVKAGEGTLGGDELQQLMSILNGEEIKKIKPLTAPETPERAQLMREAETLEVLINRATDTQHFVAIKKRFKTQALGSSDLAAAPSTGLDTYQDNASAYRKTLSPLVKWFEGMEKKSKSSLKESKPQYCVAMTM